MTRESLFQEGMLGPDEIIDFKRYPIADLSTPEAQACIAQARSSLLKTGCATFPGFLTPQAISRASTETVDASSEAYVTDAYHNAYQLPTDPNLPEIHVRNLKMHTKVASISFDRLQPHSVLRSLYLWDGLPAFVAAVTLGTLSLDESKKDESGSSLEGGKETLYRLGDALGCCSVNGLTRPNCCFQYHINI